MNKAQYMEFHRAQCDRMIEITKKKNADYAGTGDDPFSNFRLVGNFVKSKGVVEIGFVTRLSDKFARIGSFVEKGFLEVSDEGVEDTLLDMANYCILFMGFLKDKREREGTQSGAHLVHHRGGYGVLDKIPGNGGAGGSCGTYTPNEG